MLLLLYYPPVISVRFLWENYECLQHTGGSFYWRFYTFFTVKTSHNQNQLNTWIQAHSCCCSMWRSKLQTLHTQGVSVWYSKDKVFDETLIWDSFSLLHKHLTVVLQNVFNTGDEHIQYCSNCTHHCVGFLHCQRPVHHEMVVAGRTGVEWGTGRAAPWARGRPRDGAEVGECPDLRRRHWNHHGHGETGGSCLR